VLGEGPGSLPVEVCFMDVWILTILILFPWYIKLLQLRVLDFRSLHMEFGRPLQKEVERPRSKPAIKARKKAKEVTS
jgi:hypothetical protein